MTPARITHVAALLFSTVLLTGIAGTARGECSPPGSPRVAGGRTYYATDYCCHAAVWQDGCGNWVTWAPEKPAMRPKVHRRSARQAAVARDEAPIEK